MWWKKSSTHPSMCPFWWDLLEILTNFHIEWLPFTLGFVNIFSVLDSNPSSDMTLWMFLLVYGLPRVPRHCWHCTSHNRCFHLNDIKRSGYFLPGLYLWYALIWCVGFIVNPRPSRFFLTLLAGGFIVFAFHILCCGPFWVNFMERVRHLSRFVYFVCGSLLIPGPLVEKVVLLISTQMTSVAWVFFWAFYFDPLNELSFPSLVPRGVDYCSCIYCFDLE